MMTSGFLAVGYFIFSIAFSLITFVLWARIALRYFRLSILHPISQIIHRCTDPIVTPIATLLHTAKTRKSHYDWPAFTLLIIIEFMKFMLIGFLFFNTLLPWSLVVIYSICDLIVTPCNLLFYAILIRVIMSWINPGWRNPLADLVILVTEPSLTMAHRFVPYIAGFDFSPFVVIIVLKIITLFISAGLPFHLI